MKQIHRVMLGVVFSLVLLCVATPVSAGVNDFTITNYAIDYTLGRDEEKRSTLKTEETITAQFPEIDQNHGIERYIPRDYNEHPTSLQILTVTDEKGKAREYTTYTSGEYEVLRVGNADTYLHGKQTFKITYTQRDVTRHFDDTGRDEFYWDTNGTAWQVPIERLAVTVTVDDSVRSAQTENVACYQGKFGDNTPCEVNEAAGVTRASATDLAVGENVTLALGFSPGTFAEYETPLLEKLFIGWLIVQAVCFVGMFVLIFFVARRYERWAHRRNELGTIIPEYLPPKDASVQSSASIVHSHTSFTAQLIDFAVRHYVKLYETKPKSFFSTGEYELEIVKDISNLRDEEKEILNDLFNGNTAVGAKVSTSQLKKDYKLAGRLQDNPKKLKSLMRGRYGLQQRDEAKAGWFKRCSLVLLILGILLLSPSLLIVALITFVMSFVLWPLTDRGLQLYRYLEGLKMYIGVAETERLKMLQSPEGAAKVGISGSDQKQLVKLYEKTLPYAILFGQEKQWSAQLGKHYEEANIRPDWYSGATVATSFSAANFSSAVNSFTSSIDSTGASASSSGGSSGGGSSGGGGGGGGGGGW